MPPTACILTLIASTRRASRCQSPTPSWTSFFVYQFHGRKVTNADFMVASAHRSGKHSFHIWLPKHTLDGLTGREEFKACIQQHRADCAVTQEDVFNDENLVDDRVYDSRRNFRALFNTKKGTNHPLVPVVRPDLHPWPADQGEQIMAALLQYLPDGATPLGSPIPGKVRPKRQLAAKKSCRSSNGRQPRGGGGGRDTSALEREQLAML